MKNTNLIKIINGLEEEIIENVSNVIKKQVKKSGSLQNYKIVWNQIEMLAAKELKRILKNKINNCEITLQQSKSTYPDLKLVYYDQAYAIDIKCNESQKQPWFDIGRLDTFEEKRLSRFREEWELVIKYDSQTGEFIKAYFCLLRHVVGIRRECQGVKFRPYDGKIRPKEWKDFEKNIIYWKTKGEFRKGLRRAQINRWKTQVEKHIVPLLNKKEKEEFKKLF
jgi:hypothetical protein